MTTSGDSSSSRSRRTHRDATGCACRRNEGAVVAALLGLGLVGQKGLLAQAEELGGADLDASISYVQAPASGERLYIAMDTDAADTRQASRHAGRHVQATYRMEPVRIHDARPALRRGEVSLESNGLTVVHCPTQLRNEDFYNAPGTIADSYYQEVCAAVKQATGAELVLAFHHLVRNEALALKLTGGDRQKLAGYDNSSGGVGGYAPNAHADYTPKTAAGTVRQQLQSVVDTQERARHARGRYVLINAWRNISDAEPVVSQPLAVLDGASLKDEDLLTVDLRYRTFTSESLQVLPTPRHRWLYVPRMVKDELLLFKQYDSDPKARICYAFHCAFTDPSTPADSPPRESIEVRVVAFFPSTDGFSGQDLLEQPAALLEAVEVVGQLLAILERPGDWPAETRAQVCQHLAVDEHGAAESFMAVLVAWHADSNNPAGSMPGASLELQQEVLQQLRAADFQGKLKSCLEKFLEQAVRQRVQTTTAM